MKYILIYTICLFSFNGFNQTSNTFFATKLSDKTQVKLVFNVGDKLKIRYTKSNNKNKVKGVIDEIGDDYIIVEDNRIGLNQIDKVSTHKTGIKILGGILFSGGTSLIIAGSKRKQNPIIVEKPGTGKFDPDKTIVKDGDGLIALGSILCAVSTVGIITPTICTKNKYRFATNIPNGE